MEKALITKSRDSEIVNYQPEVNEKEEYQPASLKRITWARLFDIVLVSLFQFLPTFFLNRHQVGNWQSMVITVSLSLLILVTYFILLPLCCKGNTLGKLIFNLRLKCQDGNNPKWYMLVLRELYFWFIPWAIGILATSITVLIYQVNPENQVLSTMTKFIYNLGYLFFVLWYFFLAVSIKLQKNHQASVDLKFQLFVANKLSIKKLKKQKTVISNQTYQHVALVSQPGLFNSETLAELNPTDEKDFNRSINLQDLDLTTPKKRLFNHEELSLEQKQEVEDNEL